MTIPRRDGHAVVPVIRKHEFDFRVRCPHDGKPDDQLTEEAAPCRWRDYPHRLAAHCLIAEVADDYAGDVFTVTGEEFAADTLPVQVEWWWESDDGGLYLRPYAEEPGGQAPPETSAVGFVTAEAVEVEPEPGSGDAPELVTPTGVLLGEPAPESVDWFRLRRGGITATDLPKILDLSAYGNARSVWHDKRGELPRDEGGEAARWGHLLEDVVAAEWATRHEDGPQSGRQLVLLAPVGIIANRDDPWMRCALDRLVLAGCPDDSPRGTCALEVKTRSAYVAGRWRDDVPDDVLAQVAWQRRATGLDHIHIACLLGGQKLVEHRYDQDAALEAYLVEAARAVWRDVLDGTPPPVDMTGVLAALLDQLHPDRAGEHDVDPVTAADLVAEYEAAAAAVKAAEAAKDAARARVLSALGDKEILTTAGEPVFTYRPQTKTTISVRDLEANDVDLYLQVLEGGHITETTSRVLRAAKRGSTDE